MLDNQEYNNIIKEYFNKFKQIQLPCIKLFLNKNILIANYLNNELKQYPQWKNLNNIIIGILTNNILKKCKICNNFINFNKHNAKYCSSKCSNQDIEVKQKIKNAVKETNLKRYGVTSTFKLKSVQEKYKKTCLKRYGVENSLQLKNVREKIKQTTLNKYGVTNISKVKVIHNKAKETCLKKYGVLYPAQNDKIKEKTKVKVLKASFNRFLKRLKSFQDLVIPLFSFDDFIGTTSEKQYPFKCMKCGKVFYQKIYTTHFNKDYDCLPRCWNCFPYHNKLSDEETELANFCRQYFPNLKTNDKTLIHPYELDIIIPDIKLAIEFNGIYWHNINNQKPNYHLEKVKLANEKGYRLIHIWEDEWITKREEIEDRLKKVFEGKEEFEGQELRLDYSWYNNLDLKNYKLVEIEKPNLIDRAGNQVENCGYLLYIKQN